MEKVSVRKWFIVDKKGRYYAGFDEPAQKVVFSKKIAKAEVFSSRADASVYCNVDEAEHVVPMCVTFEEWSNEPK